MAAAARAAHLIVDDNPLIFADSLASVMLGERADELIGFHRAHGTHPVLSSARAQVTCRSRYTEDSLVRGLRNGISQYVILGAGLDSFAWRSRLAAQVRVFEVDHPATQEWKRQVQPALSGAILVPVDFTSDALGERLAQAGFDFTAPALVSWLGVTMYLDQDAIEEVLSVIGSFAPGSDLIVDYMLPAGLRDAAGNTYAELVGRASAEQGEPWLSCLRPAEMAALLRRYGFAAIRDVSQRDMIPAATWQRSDSLRPAELSRIAHATVAGRA